MLGSEPLEAPLPYTARDLLNFRFVFFPQTYVGVRTTAAGIFSIVSAPW